MWSQEGLKGPSKQRHRCGGLRLDRGRLTPRAAPRRQGYSMSAEFLSLKLSGDPLTVGRAGPVARRLVSAVHYANKSLTTPREAFGRSSQGRPEEYSRSNRQA